MYEPELLAEKLTTLLEALERIPRRFAGITVPDDFHTSDDGIDRLDAICMILIAAGEEFKNIDRKTPGQAPTALPGRHVAWRHGRARRSVARLLPGER